MSGITADCPSLECASKPAAGRWTAVFRAGCLWTLAAVFLMSGISKVIDPAAFLDRLIVHAGLAPTPALLIASFLPWLELIGGLCLALGCAVREAAALLMLLLCILLGYTLTHLSSADCGCFLFPALTTSTAWWWPPLRNLLL